MISQEGLFLIVKQRDGIWSHRVHTETVTVTDKGPRSSNDLNTGKGQLFSNLIVFGHLVGIIIVLFHVSIE